MIPDFEQFFRLAIGGETPPYPYQLRMATDPWPGIVDIPTGMGKTAAVIISWLFKRLRNDPDTPRRLVYCLPMRVLVEQTANNAQKWVDNLWASGIPGSTRRPTVSTLMGGEIESDWELNPEHAAIIVGTQDQLISRALNRGYAMSRYRWPIQFGLLNNDCLWIMDEVQLMGSGLATTTQLQAFREWFGVAAPIRSIWMSATLTREWLETVDFTESASQLERQSLSESDLAIPAVRRRIKARKTLIRASVTAEDVGSIAKLVLDAHEPGSRTLVVVNRVQRASELYQALQKKRPAAVLTLIHSRFRPQERAMALTKLLSEPGSEGTICVSTQVIEAGVDVSAKTLVTDLAPWESLVQRFGRCNRSGTDGEAKVFWLNLDLKKKNAALPYTVERLAQSAERLTDLTDVGLASLPQFEERIQYHHVLRRKDILDLFDTTPDLAGLDIDVSRFIRETDDHDAQVFWRDIGNEPSENEPGPHRDELCRVSIGELRGRQDLPMWKWDHLDRRWMRPSIVAPGMTIMLRKADGGYSPNLGWTGDKNHIPPVTEAAASREESNDDDYLVTSHWQTLDEHTAWVLEEITTILRECDIAESLKEPLISAAIWHDAGKAHKVLQKALLGEPHEADASRTWGKSARTNVRYNRRGFRHELASALAMLEHGFPDLAAYLAAAHHGKVRLSIRSLPNEMRPPDPDRRHARGVWDEDELPETMLCEGHTLPATKLDLSYMDLGDGPRGPSWLNRMISLRDSPTLGIFRLGFLEALLRMADWRASKRLVTKDA